MLPPFTESGQLSTVSNLSITPLSTPLSTPSLYWVRSAQYSVYLNTPFTESGQLNTVSSLMLSTPSLYWVRSAQYSV